MLEDGLTPLLFLMCRDDTPDPSSAGHTPELFSLRWDWVVPSCLCTLASPPLWPAVRSKCRARLPEGLGLRTPASLAPSHKNRDKQERVGKFTD